MIFLCFYLLSYFILSRTSLYVNDFHNLNNYHHSSDDTPRFYYIPVKEVVLNDHGYLMVVHGVLYIFYYPMYWFDYYVLSGPLCSKSLPLYELM